jgi:hypothetical protein
MFQRNMQLSSPRLKGVATETGLVVWGSVPFIRADFILPISSHWLRPGSFSLSLFFGSRDQSPSNSPISPSLFINQHIPVLKIEAAYFSETSISANKTTRYHNAEDYTLNKRCPFTTTTTTVKVAYLSTSIHQYINMPKER